MYVNIAVGTRRRLAIIDGFPGPRACTANPRLGRGRLTLRILLGGMARYMCAKCHADRNFPAEIRNLCEEMEYAFLSIKSTSSSLKRVPDLDAKAICQQQHLDQSARGLAPPIWGDRALRVAIRNAGRWS